MNAMAHVLDTQSAALRDDGAESGKVNTLYALKLSSSAELIAGVRARGSGGLFTDPHAHLMAGQHGLAVAERFCQRTPQLCDMVAARTRHLDDLLMGFVAAGGRDIVNVGVGWDMRPFRLALPEGTTFHELDFPTMLHERSLRLASHDIADPDGIVRLQYPVDLRSMTVRDVLADRLPTDRPVLIIWEGMSMYFQEPEVRAILADMRALLAHPDSLLWVDIVGRAPIFNTNAFPESVQNFMRGMQVLGEPFTFGSDTPGTFVAECGLRCLEAVASDRFFPGTADPIHSIYRFCTVASSSAGNPVPQTFRKTVFDDFVQA